jgi:hypothetical protein
MTLPYRDALSVSRKALRILITLNRLFGAAILGLLIWTFFAAAWVARALGAGDDPHLIIGMRLIMVIGGIANAVSSPTRPIHVDLKLSITPWLSVLLLFVLARVFEHEARMREEFGTTV